MDAWKTELERLSLHRSILADKLTIPSNEATQASLRRHLERVNHQLGKHIHAGLPEPEPWENGLALRDERKRFGRNWSHTRREKCRERLAELRYQQECADAGVRPMKWKPPAPGWEQRAREVLLKYGCKVEGMTLEATP